MASQGELRHGDTPALESGKMPAMKVSTRSSHGALRWPTISRLVLLGLVGAASLAGCSRIPGNNAFRIRRAQENVERELRVPGPLVFDHIRVIVGPDHHHVVCGDVRSQAPTRFGVNPRLFLSQGMHALVDPTGLPDNASSSTGSSLSLSPEAIFKKSWVGSGCSRTV